MPMKPTSSTTCHPCFGRSALLRTNVLKASGVHVWCRVSPCAACLRVCVSMRLPVCPSMRSACLSLHVPVCLSMHLPACCLPAPLHKCLPACLPGCLCDSGAEALSNSCCLQGAQLEPQLGSSKFLLVVFELLVSSHVIMVSDHFLSAYLQKFLWLSIAC